MQCRDSLAEGQRALNQVNLFSLDRLLASVGSLEGASLPGPLACGSAQMICVLSLLRDLTFILLRAFSSSSVLTYSPVV